MTRFPLIFMVFALPLVASAHPDHRFNAHLVDHRVHADDCDDDDRPRARPARTGKHHGKRHDRTTAGRHTNLHKGPRQVVVDRRAMARRLSEMEQSVADLRDLVDAIDERHVRRKLRRRIKRLDRQVDRMRAELAAAKRPPRTRNVRRAPRAMSQQRFREIDRRIVRAPFRDDKLRVVRSAVRHEHFTSAQARAIARRLPFGDDRVAALKLLHPRVVDPQNFEQVFAELHHRSHRRALEAAVYASR